MEVGKLTNEELNKHIFKHINIRRSENLVTSAIGIDTSVMDIGDKLVVSSTDPITGASKSIGSLAINISCNDIATQGAEPIGVLLSVLIPPKTTLEEIENIVKEAEKECKKLNLDIVGGHTEVTDAVNKVIITSTVIGTLDRNTLLSRKEVEIGDIVAVSKHIAIEGTLILYEENEEVKNILTEDEISEIESYREKLSVLKEGIEASNFNVKLMHDITEGGIYGALLECAKQIGKNIEIDINKIPISKTTQKICDFYSINPYKLISSGSMIFIFDPENFQKFWGKINSVIKIEKVGEIKNGENLTLIQNGKRVTITEVDKDELYKVTKY